MKTLSIRNYELIANGMNTLGFSDPLMVYGYIEESLYMNQANKIHDFLVWLKLINRPFGRVNYQDRWKEFISGEQPPKKFKSLKYSYTTVHFGTTIERKVSDKIRIKTGTSKLELAATLYSQVTSPDLNLTIEVIDQDEKVLSVIDEKELFDIMEKNSRVIDENKEFHDVVRLVRGF